MRVKNYYFYAFSTAIFKKIALISNILLILTVAANAQCSVTIKPTVSGCYQNTGASKATVSVEVAWKNPPSGNISVTFAGQTKTITPGAITVNYGYQVGNQSQTIVSPQVVAFEVPADGTAGQTIEAFFGASFAASTCKDSKTINAPVACPPLSCTSGTDMGGTVFNDYDTDGVKDSGETTGLAGVTVTAIACDGTIYTTTTDALGKYILSVPAAKYPVRVEFSGIPSLYGQGTVNGTDGRTTTQFVAAADCSVDLGVVDPNDYCQNNPNIYIPVFGNGDPRITGSTAATAAGIVTFPYDYTGSPNTAGYPANTKVTDAYNVGSQWGNAYNKKTKRMFTSAFLRRHAGLGDKGLGEIYITDLTNPAAPTTTEFINVKTDLGVTIEDASNPVLSNTARGLVGDKTTPSNDPSTISQIGRAGMGDLEISDDGNTLWFTNLYDKKIYSIDITAFNADGVTKPTTAVAHTVPDPGCSGGVARPFGLKVYKGETYVGVVCDASTSQNKSDLRAFVYKLNGATWTTVFDFPLTYPKGFGQNDVNIVTRTGWYPWTDDWNTMTNPYRTIGSTRQWAYPTPLLSDIEFDIDGSMVLGFLDRSAILAGAENYGPTGTQSYSGLACGDILKAYYSNGTYILENAAKAGPSTGASPSNNQGPGFGEFYDDNFIFTYNGGAPSLDHSEIAYGALALRPGSNEVVSTVFDPLGFEIPAGFWPNPFSVGGIIHSNNTTGVRNSGYGIYQGQMAEGLFGKSVGLGDIELACNTPTYLEVGNYVWLDVDKDGVQDACEKSLSGVNVSLYKGATKIASTITGTNGEYYFSSKSKIGTGTWDGTGVDTTLLAATAYKLVFGETQMSGTNLNIAGLGQFTVTTKDATTNTGNDQNDSDADLVSGVFCINLMTGAIGSVNHTLDAGFYCTNPNLAATITNTPATCTGTTANNNGKITLTAINSTYTKYRIKTGTSTWTGDTTFATATTIALPVDLQTAIPNAGETYKVRFYSGECCYKDTTITVGIVNCACTQPTAGTNTPTEGTCTGTTPNNDAKIDFTGITNADKAGIVEGATYTGTDYASTTGVVTAGATSFTSLKHNTQYTVRIFNAANDCFIDVTITTPAKTCLIPCTPPTAGTNTPAAGTCTGTTPNNDAKIDFTGITNADKAGIVEGATYTGTDYASTTGVVTAGAISFIALKHNTQYTVRIFNAANDCFIDLTIITPTKTCVIPCTPPTAGTNTPTAGTCTGTTANNDAKIDFTGITNADKAGIVEGATYTGTDYASTTGVVTAGAISFIALKHNTQYTVRIFNAANDCFIDLTITTPTKTCAIPCPPKVCSPVKVTKI